MVDWEHLYKTDKNPFGARPSPLIVEFLSKINIGKPVLDLGSGDGRNSIFLAQKGFKVTCVDISEAALNELSRAAKEIGVENNVTVVHDDIAKFEFHTNYGLIICFTALHFLRDSDARTLVTRIKKHTIPEGINIIADFAGLGPLKRTNEYFWLENQELKNLYDDWDVLFYEEGPASTKATDNTGKPFQQNMAKLVAENKKAVMNDRTREDL